MSASRNQQPPTPHEVSSVDKLPAALVPPSESISVAELTIAEALKGLSLEEREQVYLDQHGVTNVMDFDDKPEVVSQKLKELDSHLEALKSSPTASSAAYELAEQQNPEFCRDEHLRLRFLYAELFHTEKAANRMLRYFKNKKNMFGEEKLTKHIGLDDLTNEGLSFLKEGFIQLLPCRDSAGRAILVVFSRQAACGGSDIFGRVLFVMENCIDKNIEKKGIVIISYHLGVCQSQQWDWNSANVGARGIADLTIRTSAVHQCVSADGHRLRLNSFMMLSDLETRAKHKIHSGCHAECMKALIPYGIPVEVVPVGDDGTVKRKNHLEWLKRREILEEYRRSEVAEHYVEIPQNDDVLLGKGKPIQEHRGNMSLQHLVDDFLPQYNSMRGKIEKKELSLSVVKNIQSKNGRFLTQESGVWTVVSDDVARVKVSHLFRNRRKQAKKCAVNKTSTSLRTNGHLQVNPEEIGGLNQAGTGNKRVRMG